MHSLGLQRVLHLPKASLAAPWLIKVHYELHISSLVYALVQEQWNDVVYAAAEHFHVFVDVVALPAYRIELGPWHNVLDIMVCAMPMMQASPVGPVSRPYHSAACSSAFTALRHLRCECMFSSSPLAHLLSVWHPFWRSAHTESLLWGVKVTCQAHQSCLAPAAALMQGTATPLAGV